MSKSLGPLPKNLIIGFSGYAGSGKDTIGNILVEKHGFRRLSFADKLKEETATSFGLPLEMFHKVTLKDAPLLDMPIVDNQFTRLALGDDLLANNKFYTPRLLCIYHAAWMRGQDEQVWIKKVDRELQGNYGHVVITDLRYLNEADWVKKKFGYVIRIERGDQSKHVGAHTSETQLLNYKFDGTISNETDVADLAFKAKVMLSCMQPFGQKAGIYE